MSAPMPAAAGADSAYPMMEKVTNARRWSIVVLLLVASMINYFDRTTISFALPSISESLGFGALKKGVLLSAFFWSYAFMQIPMGLLADRFNLRWIYAAAFTLWSVSQGLTGLATSLTMLIGFRILLGIGEAIYLPGGTKTVSLLFPLSERGLPCGLFDGGTRTGLFLEGLLLPWLLSHYGWRMTFALIGFTALLWLIPWLLITPREMRVAAPSRAPEQAKPGGDVWTTRRRIDLFGVCLGFFCFDYYWYLLVTWLPDYLQTVRHLSMMRAGIYTSLPFAVFGLCQPLGGWLGDRLVRAGVSETLARKSIIGASFLTGLMLIPAAHTTNASIAILLIMSGCLVGLSTANQLVILQSCAPRDQIGFWTGVYNLVGNIGGILAPLVTGVLIQVTGSYTPAFVLAGVLIAAGQFSYWFVVGEVKPQAALLAGNGEGNTEQA
jgi:MFS transporter, ACS family, D-galactonate transporter